MKIELKEAENVNKVKGIDIPVGRAGKINNSYIIYRQSGLFYIRIPLDSASGFYHYAVGSAGYDDTEFELIPELSTLTITF